MNSESAKQNGPVVPPITIRLDQVQTRYMSELAKVMADSGAPKAARSRPALVRLHIDLIAGFFGLPPEDVSRLQQDMKNRGIGDRTVYLKQLLSDRAHALLEVGP